MQSRASMVVKGTWGGSTHRRTPGLCQSSTIIRMIHTTNTPRPPQTLDACEIWGWRQAEDVQRELNTEASHLFNQAQPPLLWEHPLHPPHITQALQQPLATDTPRHAKHEKLDGHPASGTHRSRRVLSPNEEVQEETNSKHHGRIQRCRLQHKQQHGD